MASPSRPLENTSFLCLRTARLEAGLRFVYGGVRVCVCVCDAFSTTGINLFSMSEDCTLRGWLNVCDRPGLWLCVCVCVCMCVCVCVCDACYECVCCINRTMASARFLCMAAWRTQGLHACWRTWMHAHKYTDTYKQIHTQNTWTKTHTGEARNRTSAMRGHPTFPSTHTHAHTHTCM
jgi:hypothetical protein